jgi:hypothetical protein
MDDILASPSFELTPIIFAVKVLELLVSYPQKLDIFLAHSNSCLRSRAVSRRGRGPAKWDGVLALRNFEQVSQIAEASGRRQTFPLLPFGEFLVPPCNVVRLGF